MNRKMMFLAGLCVIVALALGACQQSPSLVPGEGFVDVTGGKVWYRIVGSGTQTPLLVLHGACVPSAYLKPLEALAEDRPVIFYDQLTCGKSVGPSDTTLWTIGRYVEEIALVREALDLKEVHIYGHSWGTILAVEYILTKPSGVRSLIMAGPAFSIPRYVQDAKDLLSTLPDSVQQIIIDNERDGTLDSPDYLSAKMVYYGTFFARKQPWSDELNETFAQVNDTMWNYMWGPGMLTCAGIMCDYDRTDRLSEIATPTLLTAGEYDEARPATVEYYQSLIPGSEIAILENCGHLTIQDDPETDVRIIRDFLAGVEGK